MKHIVSLLCLVVLVLAVPASAQVRDETVLTYEVIQTERESLVLDALDLTADQRAAMVSIFDEYLEAM
jgi:hypothetical protein